MTKMDEIGVEFTVLGSQPATRRSVPVGIEKMTKWKKGKY